MMPRIVVQEADFDPGAEIAALHGAAPEAASVGGVATFLGLVRGGAVRAITLEHYPAMTARALAGIAGEAARRWPLAGCTIIHRVGRLLPGERIVLVATASAHRAASLESCAFLIDWLKTGAPFWKREERSDGSEVWVEARAADDEAAARWNKTTKSIGIS